MFDILDMGASGLQAQRTRLDTIAGNILHANTTRNEKGEKVPYRRRFVVFSPGRADDASKPGVHVSQIGMDDSPPLKKFEPGHPDADADGYVKFPNIDTAIEYVNSIEATRAYEANITMMEVSKSMFNSSLRLIA
ncbi:MAG: flagellar basal-body rod protein FlgC [Phycisphaerales bacterium]|jgi:flagellar basal-body rod protein FlgC|nr:flagellar basal-body rod protein FlgC [Phycisphaerales bacterium]